MPRTCDGLIPLLDALADPVAARACDGHSVYENASLRHLAAREPRDSELRGAIARIGCGPVARDGALAAGVSARAAAAGGRRPPETADHRRGSFATRVG